MPLQTRYLDRFRYLAGSTLSSEIFAKLQLDREDGKIRTIAEFREELNRLLPRLHDRILTPIAHKVDFQEGQLVDIDELNDVLNLIAVDILAAFEEHDNIEATLAAQQELMLRAVSQDLKRAIRKLKAEIEIHELIAKLSQGNTQSFGNSTIQAHPGEFLFGSRTDKDLDALYLDPITNEELGQEYNCSVTKGDYLQLPVLSRSINTARDARVVVEDVATRPSQASEFAVELPGLGPENVIDGLDNTYWARSVLLTQPKTDEPTDSNYQGVLHKLEIEYHTPITFNYLTIEPILSNEAYLVSVEIFNEGSWSTLWETGSGTGGIQLKGARTIFFTTTTATSIRLSFESRSYKTITFLAEQDNETEADRDTSTMRQLLQNEFNDTEARNALGALEQSLSEREFYEYFIGIDNIITGIGELADKGIFVSQKLSYGKLSRIGIATDWLIPYRATTGTDISYTETPETDIALGANVELLGSIELYLAKWDYQDKEKTKLIKRSFFPLVPLFRGQRVFDRLLLTTKEGSLSDPVNDVGFLRFFADAPNGLTTDVLIFKDGEAASWSESSKSQDVLNGNKPMKQAIQISGAMRDSSYVAIYTVQPSNIEGKPRFDGTVWTTDSDLLKYNDVLGDLSTTLDSQGFYHFDLAVKETPIACSEVAVVVALRNNGGRRYPGVTPILKNYRILGIEENAESI